MCVFVSQPNRHKAKNYTVWRWIVVHSSRAVPTIIWPNPKTNWSPIISCVCLVDFPGCLHEPSWLDPAAIWERKLCSMEIYINIAVYIYIYCIYFSLYIYMYLHIYIYVYIRRARKLARDLDYDQPVCWSEIWEPALDHCMPRYPLIGSTLPGLRYTLPHSTSTQYRTVRSTV